MQHNFISKTGEVWEAEATRIVVVAVLVEVAVLAVVVMPVVAAMEEDRITSSLVYNFCE